MDFETSIFDVQELRNELIHLTINEVVKALEDRGYNPVNQLVGYLKTGDEKYITNYNDARSKILKFDRSEILLVVLDRYLGR